jgi:hypothetical protein
VPIGVGLTAPTPPGYDAQRTIGGVPEWLRAWYWQVHVRRFDSGRRLFYLCVVLPLRVLPVPRVLLGDLGNEPWTGVGQEPVASQQRVLAVPGRLRTPGSVDGVRLHRSWGTAPGRPIRPRTLARDDELRDRLLGRPLIA